MKKFNLSLVAVLAMSTFAIAGGDIAPIEEPMVEPVVEDSGTFYLGLGYGAFNNEISFSETIGAVTTRTSIDDSMDTVLLQAGYEFNEYIAVEGRYWIGASDLGDLTGDFSAWGLYVKPQYPVAEAFNVYALLGYGYTDLDFDNASIDYLNTSSFSWGLGAEYKFTENVSIFLDYVSVGDTDEIDFRHIGGLTDITVDADVAVTTVNFGVTYRF